MLLGKKILSFLVFSIFLASSSLQAETTQEEIGATYLEQTSKAFTHIGEKATPSVVFIKTYMKHRSNPRSPHFGDQLPFNFFHDEFFRRFFGEIPQQKRVPQQQEPHEQPLGQGSGFIISNDGYVITNYHVIQNADEVEVVLHNEEEYKAKVVGFDPRTDIAVLKIEAEKDFPYLKFADSDNVRTGEWVIAIGTPFTLQSTLTVGVVSATGRQDLGIASLEDFLQISAPTNPGNSGGPAINLKGEVIGINTAIVHAGSQGFIGIGFAIPSNLAKHVTKQIIETGTVKRTYLGIIHQAIDKKLADALGLKDIKHGVLITEVCKDSPAEKAGIQNGDVIVELNGKPVKSHKKLRNEIALSEPGREIHLKILRNHQPETFHITLETLTESEVSSAENFFKLGFEAENVKDLPAEIRSKLGLTKDNQGIVITKIKPGSAAAYAGLQPYYLITAAVVNQGQHKQIKSMDDLTQAIKESDHQKYIVLIVRHSNHYRYYTVDKRK